MQKYKKYEQCVSPSRSSRPELSVGIGYYGLQLCNPVQYYIFWPNLTNQNHELPKKTSASLGEKSRSPTEVVSGPVLVCLRRECVASWCHFGQAQTLVWVLMIKWQWILSTRVSNIPCIDLCLTYVYFHTNIEHLDTRQLCCSFSWNLSSEWPTDQGRV